LKVLQKLWTGSALGKEFVFFNDRGHGHLSIAGDAIHP
jgi:hypothetical protein